MKTNASIHMHEPEFCYVLLAELILLNYFCNVKNIATDQRVDVYQSGVLKLKVKTEK